MCSTTSCVLQQQPHHKHTQYATPSSFVRSALLLLACCLQNSLVASPKWCRLGAQPRQPCSALDVAAFTLLAAARAKFKSLRDAVLPAVLF
jgi:hypothetical protein